MEHCVTKYGRLDPAWFREEDISLTPWKGEMGEAPPTYPDSTTQSSTAKPPAYTSSSSASNPPRYSRPTEEGKWDTAPKT